MKDKFISDMGRSFYASDEISGKKIKVYRYGVWAYDYNRQKYQVIDTGSNLENLMVKHGISPETEIKRIFR